MAKTIHHDQTKNKSSLRYMCGAKPFIPLTMSALAQLKANIQTNLKMGKHMEIANLVNSVKPSDVPDSAAAAALLQILLLCIDDKCCAQERKVQVAIINQIRSPIQTRADDKTYFDAAILSNRILLIQGTIPRTFSFQEKKMNLEQFKTFVNQHGQFQANQNPLMALELMRTSLRLGNTSNVDLLCGLAIFCGRVDVLRELSKTVNNKFLDLVLKK